MFHVIQTCLVSLVLDIRLNTLAFKFFITSGTHIPAFGALLLLQLPLHLLVLMLKEKDTGSSILHKQFVVLLYILDCSLKYNLMNLRLLKLIKLLILQKKIFLTNSNILLHHFIFFYQLFMNFHYIINCNSIIINTKIINITIKSSFFHIIC